MASVIELQNRIKLLESFSKVVNIQKIVVMKTIAELKGRMKALANSYDLLYKIVNEIKTEQPALFDSKLFIKKGEELEEIKESDDATHYLNKMLVNDSRTSHKKAIFLMSTQPTDKLSRYSIIKMAEQAKKAYNEDILFIALGDVLIKEMKKAGVPIYASLGDKVVFGKTNLVFKNIAELTLQIYNSLTATNISFVFDDIENPIELRELPLLPFTSDLGKSQIDFTALAGTQDEDVNKILDGVDIKKTIFDRGLEVTGDFIVKMQIQNVIELAHLSYVLSSSNRELHNLDDKEKNVEAEQEITKLQMQRIRKESITNELISTSGAFMAMSKEEEDE